MRGIFDINYPLPHFNGLVNLFTDILRPALAITEKKRSLDEGKGSEELQQTCENCVFGLASMDNSYASSRYSR